ncbi:MAG TPA: helix-turn-helix transcriptional regulator [Lachnospiraceae bacterium]|nr:helix-turn-helix transcriptional regulator [Lachnospiraceae bacterium]
MDKQKTGELIRQARTEKGYTQSELGDLIGVSNKAVSRWEIGESFPDISVLESLSGILDLKVQDIVIGEVGGDNSDAVTEIVRVAKIQEKDKYRKFITAGVWLILFCYLLNRGYWNLRGNSSGTRQTTLYYYSLAVILMIVSGMCIIGKKTMNPFRNKVSKWISIISMVTGIYIIISMSLTMWMVCHERTPFNMELSSVGSFLNNQLIVIFILNIVAILIEYFRMSVVKLRYILEYTFL